MMNNQKTLFSIIEVGLMILTVISCSVATGSNSLENEVYLNTIQGTYKLTDAAVLLLNQTDHYFTVSPSPAFSVSDLFVIDGFGTININNINNTSSLVLRFCSSVLSTTNSAVYQVLTPDVTQSGALIKSSRFLKVQFDQNTNLIFSSLTANTEDKAQSLVADVLYADRVSS